MNSIINKRLWGESIILFTSYIIFISALGSCTSRSIAYTLILDEQKYYSCFTEDELRELIGKYYTRKIIPPHPEVRMDMRAYIVHPDLCVGIFVYETIWLYPRPSPGGTEEALLRFEDRYVRPKVDNSLIIQEFKERYGVHFSKEDMNKLEQRFNEGTYHWNK